MQYVIEKYNYSRSVQAINYINCENITMQKLKVTINISTQLANPCIGFAKHAASRNLDVKLLLPCSALQRKTQQSVCRVVCHAVAILICYVPILKLTTQGQTIK